MTAPIASSLGSGISRPEPGARVDEGHVAAVVGPEAQEAAAGGGLEERAPARRHAVGERLVAEVLREGLAEGGAGHRRVGEHVADPVLEGEHLLPGDLEVAEPHRPQPVDPRAERRDQLRQLVRGDEVERPAHRPGLDQRAVAPQGVPDVVAASCASTRAWIASSAEPMTCACTATWSRTTSSIALRGARRSRCCRRSRSAASFAQVVSITPSSVPGRLARIRQVRGAGIELDLARTAFARVGRPPASVVGAGA